MEGACHERIVFNSVAEHHQLTCADALAVRRKLGRLLDDTRHFEHGIHVDAGARRANVHRRAHTLGGSERLRDGIHQLVISCRSAFVHERREATDEINTNFKRCFIHGARNGGEVVRSGCRTDLCDGCDRDALVHDGHTIFTFKLVSCGNELLSSGGEAVVDLARNHIDLFMGATAQIEPECDSANVKVLFADHGKCFGDLFRRDLHGSSLFCA